MKNFISSCDIACSHALPSDSFLCIIVCENSWGSLTKTKMDQVADMRSIIAIAGPISLFVLLRMKVGQVRKYGSIKVQIHNLFDFFTKNFSFFSEGRMYSIAQSRRIWRLCRSEFVCVRPMDISCAS